MYHDRGAGHAFALDQLEQRGGVGNERETGCQVVCSDSLRLACAVCQALTGPPETTRLEIGLEGETKKPVRFRSGRATVN